MMVLEDTVRMTGNMIGEDKEGILNMRMCLMLEEWELAGIMRMTEDLIGEQGGWILKSTVRMM